MGLYAVLADVVVALHLGFVAFVVAGGLLASRHRWWRVGHLGATAWAAGIVTVGWPCPLTALERELRTRAGEAWYDEGFVDRYLTGVVYPESWERLVQVVVALVIVATYAWGLRTRHREGSSLGA